MDLFLHNNNNTGCKKCTLFFKIKRRYNIKEKIMNLEIQTPTQQIFKKMLNDDWITIDAIVENRIRIELILMYQHAIMPLNEFGIDYDNKRFELITIKGQIDAHEIAIKNCKIGDIEYKDDFFEALAVMHNSQLKILKNLKNIMITQYN